MGCFDAAGSYYVDDGMGCVGLVRTLRVRSANAVYGMANAVGRDLCGKGGLPVFV